MKLKGKRAIVTGSSAGIGREIALLLAAQGASVAINARGSGPKGIAAVDEVVDEIRAKGGIAIGVAGAVDDPKFAQELVEQCVSQFGGIDILINNAAIYGVETIGPIDQCSVEAWEETLRVNLSGPFYTTRIALQYMIKQRWGRIINAASYAGTGKMGGSAYSSAKSGLFGFTRALAADYGPYGITANVYNPEAFSVMNDPEVFKQALVFWKARGYRSDAEVAYYANLGGAEGVAPWVAYLATEEAGYLNGRVFAVESRRVAMLAQPDEEKILYHDFANHGPMSLDELTKLAPLVFPVSNDWPRREGDALARWEKGIV